VHHRLDRRHSTRLALLLAAALACVVAGCTREPPLRCDVPVQVQPGTTLEQMVGRPVVSVVRSQVHDAIVAHLEAAGGPIDPALVGSTSALARETLADLLQHFVCREAPDVVWEHPGLGITIARRLEGRTLHQIVGPQVADDLEQVISSAARDMTSRHLGSSAVDLAGEIARGTDERFASRIGDWRCIWDARRGGMYWYNFANCEWGGRC
jgi:hypothetical protein